MDQSIIRKACLQPASLAWPQPSGEEVRELLRRAGFTGGQAARKLGLGERGDRTVRRWISEESAIPYACWALLADFAGFGPIWKAD